MIAGAALLLAYWVHCRCTMPLVRARSAGRDGDDVSTQYRTLYGERTGRRTGLRRLFHVGLGHDASTLYTFDLICYTNAALTTTASRPLRSYTQNSCVVP